MRIAVFTGRSQYGVLDRATEEAIAAFRARGHEVVAFALPEDGDAARLFAGVQNAAPFAMGFSYYPILGRYTDDKGRTIADFLRAPLVLHYVDSPLMPECLKHLDATARATALLFVDASHVRDVQALFGRDRFAHLAFVPHGALGAPQILPAEAEAYGAARPIRFLFAGSYRTVTVPPWREFPQNIRKLLDTTLDLVLSQAWFPVRDALDRALTLQGIDVQDPAHDAQLQNVRRMFCCCVEEWVRCIKRRDFLMAAARAGLPLTIYGVGSDVLKDMSAHFDCRGAADIAEILQTMGRTRVAINVCPHFGEGSHERPLTAMLAGAAAATDRTQFFETQFRADRDLLLYSWRDADAAVARIMALEQDSQALFAMAVAGQQTVAARHRWACRVDDYLAAAQAVAAI